MSERHRITPPALKATLLFDQGFNCAQAVFCALVDDDLISHELALKITSPFGGGIARQGEICGALSGALMVLGLRLGNVVPADKENTYKLAERFIEAFRTKHGSIRCCGLLGVDISTDEGLSKARENYIFEAICPALVRQTTESIQEFLNKAFA